MFEDWGKSEDHCVVEVEVMGCSLDEAVGLGRSRRVKAWTALMEGCVRRMERIDEPWGRVSKNYGGMLVVEGDVRLGRCYLRGLRRPW
jgi:hypothetical protein